LARVWLARLHNAKVARLRWTALQEKLNAANLSFGLKRGEHGGI
jgi:hypothetical protein